MDDCDIRSPYWNSKNCPRQYDASHVCRACQLQKVSEERVICPFHTGMNVDKVCLSVVH